MTATTQPRARASAESAALAPKAARETSVPARSARTSWSIGPEEEERDEDEKEEEAERLAFRGPLKVTTPAVAQRPSLLASPESVDLIWSSLTNWAPMASTREEDEEEVVKDGACEEE